MQRWVAELYEHESTTTLRNFYKYVQSPTTLHIFYKTQHKKYKFQSHFNSSPYPHPI